MPFQMNAIRRSEWAGFFFGGAIGAIVFILIWGGAPLNPFDLDWMAVPYGSDPSFAGIGSLRFIKEPWSFPLGVIHGLVYPNRTSIVFVDGIPFVALLAKLVSTVVHRDFQYFGFWGLFCAILQGALGAAILQKSCKDSFVSAIGAVFFTLSPFFLGKMFGHVSMAGQWVLLLALLLIESRRSEYVKKNEILLWALISIVSMGVIVYFTPMIFLMMILYYWLRLEECGNLAFYRLFFSGIISAIGCLITFWIFGGFLPGTDVSLNDYGLAPFNLNGLFNPGGESRLLQPWPAGKGGGEGYAWLGLGVVIGGLYLTIDGILHPTKPRSELLRRALPYCVISIVFVAYAATNVVMFGNWVVAEYPLPPSILSFFSMFRTSARFIWPVWYLLVILIVGGIAGKTTPKWRREIVLILLVCVQVFDDFPLLFLSLNKTDHSNPPLPLASEFWARMDGIQHVIFAPAVAGGKVSQEAWGYIEYQAVRQDITTNTFWLGRYPMQPVLARIQEKIQGLRKGELADGDLFIVNMPNLLSAVNFSEKLAAYAVDGQFLVGRPGMAVSGNGLKNIAVKRTLLADYLKHLETLGPDSLIIMTARSTQNPVVFDDATRQEMEKFNINNILDNASNFNYISIFGKGLNSFYQTMSKNQVSFLAKKGDFIGEMPIPSDIKISVSNDFGKFPEIYIGGEDFSENYIGMNICVYDLGSGKVLEVGTFDLYAMTDGVYVQF